MLSKFIIPVILLPYTLRSPKIPVFEFPEALEHTFPDGKTIVIPVGYVTDFNSIPTFLWSWLAPMHVQSRRAAVIHDWLYENRVALMKRWNMNSYQLRLYADVQYYRILIEDGYPTGKSIMHFLGVRIGGKKWFDE